MTEPGFPKQLRHPGYSPAVLSDDYAGGRGRHARDAPPGRPAQRAPVTVNNSDQEEYYLARGYEVSGSLPIVPHQGAIMAAPIGRSSEYPKWVDGVLVQDPNAPPPPVQDNEYPKWVGSTIVKSAEEEAALVLRGTSKNEPVQPRAEDETPGVVISGDELAEFRQWKALMEREKAAKALAELAATQAHYLGSRNQRHEDAERAELVALAEEAGIRIDRRWRLEKLRDAVDRATRPETVTSE